MRWSQRNNPGLYTKRDVEQAETYHYRTHNGSGTESYAQAAVERLASGIGGAADALVAVRIPR